MKIDLPVKLLLAVVALSLVKIAFFPQGPGLVPQAHADGGVMEWRSSLRIVTSGDNGTSTCVWDYEGRTKVRKYTIEGDSLVLKTYTLKGD